MLANFNLMKRHKSGQQDKDDASETRNTFPLECTSEQRGEEEKTADRLNSWASGPSTNRPLSESAHSGQIIAIIEQQKKKSWH